MEKRRENKTVSNPEGGKKKGQTWRGGSGINALQGGGERCAYVRTFGWIRGGQIIGWG